MFFDIGLLRQIGLLPFYEILEPRFSCWMPLSFRKAKWIKDGFHKHGWELGGSKTGFKKTIGAKKFKALVSKILILRAKWLKNWSQNKTVWGGLSGSKARFKNCSGELGDLKTIFENIYPAELSLSGSKTVFKHIVFGWGKWLKNRFSKA